VTTKMRYICNPSYPPALVRLVPLCMFPLAKRSDSARAVTTRRERCDKREREREREKFIDTIDD
jgi:hypothetical protein